GNRDPSYAWLVRKIRKRDEPAGVQTAHVAQLILVLPRRLITIEDQRVGGSVIGIGELGEFVGDARLANGGLFGDDVAEGHAVIEGAHFDRQLAAGGIFEIGTHAVVVVPHFVRLACGEGVDVVGALGMLGSLAHAFAQDRLPDEV